MLSAVAHQNGQRLRLLDSDVQQKMHNPALLYLKSSYGSDGTYHKQERMNYQCQFQHTVITRRRKNERYKYKTTNVIIVLPDGVGVDEGDLTHKQFTIFSNKKQPEHALIYHKTCKITATNTWPQTYTVYHQKSNMLISHFILRHYKYRQAKHLVHWIQFEHTKLAVTNLLVD